MFRIALVTFWVTCQVAAEFATGSPDTLDLSNVIIVFDPHVSILDIYNRGRYNADELVPLISKVATRFTKITIAFDHSDVYIDPTQSSSLSGFAAAKYNCLSSTKIKVQVFMTILADNCHCGEIKKSLRNATRIADEINDLCNETIDTIFLETSSTKCWSIMKKCGRALNLSDHYKWGEIIPVSDYCNAEYSWNSKFIPASVLVDYIDWEDAFSINLTNCKPYGNNSSQIPIVLKSVDFTDTNGNNYANFKGFAEIWKRIADDRMYTFLVDGSFDVFANSDDDTLSISNNGWWYLEKDPGTTNTSEFKFREKYSAAAKIDHEENPNFLPWYLEKPFNTTTNGIVFQGNFANIAKRKDFCRIISSIELDDLESVVNNAIAMTNICGDNFQLFLIINELSIETLKSIFKLRKEQFILLINVDIHKKPSVLDERYHTFIKDSGFQLGHYIDMDYCGQYNYADNASKSIIEKVLLDTKSSAFIFHYEEYKDTVELGATRMFRIRSVLFEECTKLVFQNRNTSFQIGYALRAFYKRKNFYNSKWAMKNYVKYIGLLSAWAKNRDNTVVFLGLDEDRNYKGYYGRSWETVGWYSYNDFVEKKGYKPRSGEPLIIRTSVNNDPLYNSYIGLNSNQLIIVFCAILMLLAITILVGVYLFRRNRTNYQLTYKETKMFFDGQSIENEQTEKDPNAVKYDKAKYEISERNFKLYTNELLGSGEYGKVYSGTVMRFEEEVQTAIKTTNPQKLHKTMINGLLSEIKVLAHVGYHPNITQLFGANTSSIRTGKVYVFLELCSLGSLESYLKKFRPANFVAEKDTEQDLSKTDTKYINIPSNRKRLLDASLSKDFNRWSKEICCGMEYLAGKQVVHADLATRNVLLNSQKIAKICDFGLSRRMYNYTSYVKSQQEPLPWRWMAPESLRYNVFNEKTDVWAFGVTLWEMFSLGSIPYAGLSWDANFVRMLEGGLVPSEPDFNENNMYETIRKCWRISPNDRPTFAEVSSILNSSDF